MNAHLAAVLVTLPLCGQSVSLGFREGIPLAGESIAFPYVIGPAVEFALPHSISAAGDFLVRHYRLTLSPSASRAGIWRWEAPVTLAYRFHAPARPFLRAGFSFNGVFRVTGAMACAPGPFGEQFYCVERRPLLEMRHRRTSGLVFAGGLRFKLKKLWLEPELRLTHWFDRNFGVRDSPVRSSLNQADLLFGIVF